MDIGILSREVVQFNTCRSPFGGKLHPILWLQWANVSKTSRRPCHVMLLDAQKYFKQIRSAWTTISTRFFTWVWLERTVANSCMHVINQQRHMFTSDVYYAFSFDTTGERAKQNEQSLLSRRASEIEDRFTWHFHVQASEMLWMSAEVSDSHSS